MKKEQPDTEQILLMLSLSLSLLLPGLQVNACPGTAKLVMQCFTMLTCCLQLQP